MRKKAKGGREGYPGVFDLGGSGLTVRHSGLPNAKGDRHQQSNVLPGNWDWDDALAILAVRKAAVGDTRKANRHLIHLSALYAAFQKAKAKDPRFAPSTGTRYAQHWANQVERLLGDPRLVDLTRDVMFEYLDSLSEVGSYNGGPLAPKTVRLTHGFLHVMFEWGVRKKFLDSNPTDGWDLPPLDAHENGVALDPFEVALLREAIENPVVRAATALMVGTGLRSGEVRGLSRENVRLEELVLNARDQWVDIERAVRPPKGRVSRLVPIPAVVGDILAEYVSWLERAANAGDIAYDRELDLLFPGKTGGYMTGSALRWRVAKASHAAGLGHVTPHDLRRTNVTLSDLESESSAELAGGMLNAGQRSVAMRKNSYERTLRRQPWRIKKTQRRVAEHLDAELRPALRRA